MEAKISIDVQEIKKLDMPRGAVKGFADLRIDFGSGGYMSISGLSIVKPNGREWFVSPPQRQYNARDGSTKYQTIVGFFGSLREEISHIVLDAWKKRGFSEDAESYPEPGSLDPFESDSDDPAF